MTHTRLSTLLSLCVLQSACYSYTPPPVTYIPPPDPSVYASLTCEEMAYKRASYQQLVQNAASDQPDAEPVYALSMQSQYQGLSNAISQRGCPAAASAGASISTADFSCQAVYQDIDNKNNIKTGLGTSAWHAGRLASNPARSALPEFQAYLASQGKGEGLDPMTCSTAHESQSCSAGKSVTTPFSMRTVVVIVSCIPSQEMGSGEQMLKAVPFVQRIDWRPANTAPYTGPRSPAASAAAHGSPAKPVAAPQATPAPLPAPVSVPPIAAPAPQPIPAPVAAGAYCYAAYEVKKFAAPLKAATGLISSVWQAGALSTEPAREALPRFQSYLASRGHNEALDPMACSSTGTYHYCAATRLNPPPSAALSHVAIIWCEATQRSAEAGRAMRAQTTSPLLQSVDWRPDAAR